MHRYYFASKCVKFADFLDSVGKFNLSDRYIKIAQMSELDPKLLEFLATSTNREELLKILQIDGKPSNSSEYQKTFRNLIKKIHPDINPTNPEFSAKLFNKIYNLMKDGGEPLDDLSEDFVKMFPKAPETALATIPKASETASATGEAVGATGATGEAVGATGATGEAVGATGATGKAVGATGATGEAVGAGAEAWGGAKAGAGVANEAKAAGLFPKLMANPAFKGALELFEKAAPGLKWLPPVAVAIELAAKAMSGEELDGFDVAKLASGMALIPPVAAAISSIPVVGPAFLALATVAAFGGTDVARFVSDHRKGLDLFGMNIAVDQKKYDNIIDQAIQSAKTANILNRYIKTANKTEIEKHIIISYLLQRKAINDYLNAAIKKASSNKTFFSNRIFKSAQAQESSLQQYLERYMRIDTSSLASIASSIELNVQEVSKGLPQANLGQDKNVESAVFESWVDSQIRGATKYKENAGTAFSGFGIGEARKNEVQKIADSLNMIPLIRKEFRKKIGWGHGLYMEPKNTQNTSGQKNYFDKAGINSNSYTGTAEQNEKLRKAIDPSAPDFDTAFRKKFNKAPGAWNSPERLNALKQPAL